MAMVDMDREKLIQGTFLKEGRMGLGGIGCRSWEKKISQRQLQNFCARRWTIDNSSDLLMKESNEFYF